MRSTIDTTVAATNALRELVVRVRNAIGTPVHARTMSATTSTRLPTPTWRSALSRLTAKNP